MKSLVLFDIDGTLGGHPIEGVKSFKSAYEQYFQTKFPEMMESFAGKTDLGIVRQLSKVQNRDFCETQANEFFDLYHEVYQKVCEQSPFQLFTGAVELVEYLSGHSKVEIGLVTGNIERCARLKLSSGPVDHYFEFGGFGDEHHCRNELASIALDRAHKRNQDLDSGFRKVFLVGDTPSDINAAHSINATSVGVSTKLFNQDALKQKGAHHVVDTMSELKQFLSENV